MRGKKIDSDFITEFIVKCTLENINSSEDIINKAKKNIEDIDFKIKEVEKLKILRSKLLDVIISFDTPDKKESIDKKILHFFQIQNQHICKEICDQLKNEGRKINMILKLLSKNYSSQDTIFCIKQLLEYKILYKKDDVLLRGMEFDNYLKFVIKETV